MTAVAWDGKTLATDKRALFGWGIAGDVSKLERWEGHLLAFSGIYTCAKLAVAWFKSNPRDPAKYPGERMLHDGGSTLLVIDPVGKILVYQGDPEPIYFEGDQFAMGHAGGECRVAMACGLTAVEAVQMAHRFDASVGAEVDWLELHEGDHSLREKL